MDKSALAPRARPASYCPIATVLLAALFFSFPSGARAELAIDELHTEPTEQPPDPRDIADGDFPFELRKIADKLVLPWSMAFLPDGRMLVTERPGRLRMIEGNRLVPGPIAGVPEVLSGGHSGLLDVVIDPNFSDTHRLYLSYMHGTSGAATI